MAWPVRHGERITVERLLNAAGQGGDGMKKQSTPIHDKDHEQAKQLLAMEAIAVSRHAGLSVKFCAKIALNRAMRRVEALAGTR